MCRHQGIDQGGHAVDARHSSDLVWKRGSRRNEAEHDNLLVPLPAVGCFLRTRASTPSASSRSSTYSVGGRLQATYSPYYASACKGLNKQLINSSAAAAGITEVRNGIEQTILTQASRGSTVREVRACFVR